MKTIVTRFTDICAVCGRTGDIVSHHLVFGRGIRNLADEDLLILPICNGCHNMKNDVTGRIHDNPMAENLSKMLGQVIWEKHYIAEKSANKDIEDEARLAFLKRYGRSWL